jgi:hypothetical protein
VPGNGGRPTRADASAKAVDAVWPAGQASAADAHRMSGRLAWFPRRGMATIDDCAIALQAVTFRDMDLRRWRSGIRRSRPPSTTRSTASHVPHHHRCVHWSMPLHEGLMFAQKVMPDLGDPANPRLSVSAFALLRTSLRLFSFWPFAMLAGLPARRAQPRRHLPPRMFIAKGLMDRWATRRWFF